jgi:hypothetical protein
MQIIVIKKLKKKLSNICPSQTDVHSGDIERRVVPSVLAAPALLAKLRCQNVVYKDPMMVGSYVV